MSTIYGEMRDAANRRVADFINKEENADNCISRTYYHVRATMAGRQVQHVYNNKDVIKKYSR